MNESYWFVHNAALLSGSVIKLEERCFEGVVLLIINILNAVLFSLFNIWPNTMLPTIPELYEAVKREKSVYCNVVKLEKFG